MEDNQYILFFYLLLPVVAFLYATVGHGGASGYLALMVLFNFIPVEMKSTALILNICVSGIAFINFLKKGHFNLPLFLWIGIAAIPFAFLGGTLLIENQIYKKVLALFLIFAVFKLLGFFDRKNDETLQKYNPYLASGLGASIGFISGLIGIGGGIILTPILLFFRWVTFQQAAGISALFIFVNSVAGLTGLHLKSGLIINHHIYLLILLVTVGGFTGAYIGSNYLKSKILKKILALVLLIASIKLFFQ